MVKNKDMENYYLTKNVFEGAIKDVDVQAGIITGYFSVFGNVDTDGDIVLPGAFKKTIKENGPDSPKPRILHLYMHDPAKILSKPHVLKEDKHGLYFESKISETSLGKDVLQLYRDKVLTEHSIGYQIVKREVDESGKERIQKLVELKLWEGSTVGWGANMEALVSTVKSEGKQGKTFDNIIEKIKALESAVKGTYTDDTARELEIQLNQLKQLVIDSLTEPVSSTPEPIDGKLLAEILKSKIKF
jgi:uncharacterized protein